jgi:hypothetical protein
MIYGKWDVKLDYGWRLFIPTSLKKQIERSKVVFFSTGKDGCVRVSMSPFQKNINYLREIREGGKVVVPKQLRSSTSFYFGRKVVLVLKKDGKYFLELWPDKQN